MYVARQHKKLEDKETIEKDQLLMPSIILHDPYELHVDNTASLKSCIVISWSEPDTCRTSYLKQQDWPSVILILNLSL